MKEADLGKLQEIAEIEGTEIGDLCNILINLHQYYQAYFRLSAFGKALESELAAHLKYFMKHSKIVEHEEEVKHKWKMLEWD